MSTLVRITYDQYEEMIERGDFDDDDTRRFELILGEIVEMPRPNPPHDNSSDLLTEWSFLHLPLDRVRIRIGGSVALREVDSLPLPDLAWLRRLDYAQRHPTVGDVFTVIEISDSTLAKDRGTKMTMYALAGMPDYWIVNIPEQCIEVHRDPHLGVFRDVQVYRAGQEIRPLAFPDLAFPVALIFSE